MISLEALQTFDECGAVTIDTALTPDEIAAANAKAPIHRFRLGTRMIFSLTRVHSNPPITQADGSPMILL